MKFYTISLTKLVYLFSLCDATILIKGLKNVKVDFRMRIQTGSYINDPLYKFSRSLRSVRTFCNAIQAANQYEYKPYSYVDGIHSVSVPASDDLITQSKCQQAQSWSYFYNYHYTMQSVKVGQKHANAMVFHCFYFPDLKYYVTFGLADKFMYLINPMDHKRFTELGPSAIFEPRAILKSTEERQLLEYFWNQLQQRAQSWTLEEVRKIIDRKMSIVCHLNLYDHVRVCSSASDILSSEGYLQNDVGPVNLVYLHRGHRCITKNLKTHVGIVSMRVLPCIIDRRKGISQFFVLKDPKERDAIFVFVPQHEKNIEIIIMKALIGKIGALVNPGQGFADL